MVLLTTGTDANIKDKKGKTALAYAQESASSHREGINIESSRSLGSSPCILILVCNGAVRAPN